MQHHTFMTFHYLYLSSLWLKHEKPICKWMTQMQWHWLKCVTLCNGISFSRYWCSVSGGPTLSMLHCRHCRILVPWLRSDHAKTLEVLQVLTENTENSASRQHMNRSSGTSGCQQMRTVAWYNLLLCFFRLPLAVGMMLEYLKALICIILHHHCAIHCVEPCPCGWWTLAPGFLTTWGQTGSSRLWRGCWTSWQLQTCVDGI